ncbi:hypothetical protein CXG81DRAFT_24772 [Caulochytrium protostelioides]|uniref:Beige protein homolog 1 n=1 Tax=Caulochytrium protostelioides TaxID=1555241 RepID=A0A4P9XBP4_9FUNG|nr:hypothetical protein CXG81DRAFT_24772 [Caulochytrium protostelioides]|eukprot:RKP02560.1 hypothetical protein CXG81DRAFT_24772 [Caulochytrium protostelioides]
MNWLKRQLGAAEDDAVSGALGGSGGGVPPHAGSDRSVVPASGGTSTAGRAGTAAQTGAAAAAATLASLPRPMRTSYEAALDGARRLDLSGAMNDCCWMLGLVHGGPEAALLRDTFRLVQAWDDVQDQQIVLRESRKVALSLARASGGFMQRTVSGLSSVTASFSAGAAGAGAGAAVAGAGATAAAGGLGPNGVAAPALGGSAAAAAAATLPPGTVFPNALLLRTAKLATALRHSVAAAAASRWVPWPRDPVEMTLRRCGLEPKDLFGNATAPVGSAEAAATSSSSSTSAAADALMTTTTDDFHLEFVGIPHLSPVDGHHAVIAVLQSVEAMAQIVFGLRDPEGDDVTLTFIKDLETGLRDALRLVDLLARYRASRHFLIHHHALSALTQAAQACAHILTREKSAKRFRAEDDNAIGCLTLVCDAVRHIYDADGLFVRAVADSGLAPDALSPRALLPFLASSRRPLADAIPHWVTLATGIIATVSEHDAPLAHVYLTPLPLRLVLALAAITGLQPTADFQAVVARRPFSLTIERAVSLQLARLRYLEIDETTIQLAHLALATGIWTLHLEALWAAKAAGTSPDVKAGSSTFIGDPYAAMSPHPDAMPEQRSDGMSPLSAQRCQLLLLALAVARYDGVHGGQGALSGKDTLASPWDPWAAFFHAPTIALVRATHGTHQDVPPSPASRLVSLPMAASARAWWDHAYAAADRENDMRVAAAACEAYIAIALVSPSILPSDAVPPTEATNQERQRRHYSALLDVMRTFMDAVETRYQAYMNDPNDTLQVADVVLLFLTWLGAGMSPRVARLRPAAGAAAGITPAGDLVPFVLRSKQIGSLLDALNVWGLFLGIAAPKSVPEPDREGGMENVDDASHESHQHAAAAANGYHHVMARIMLALPTMQGPLALIVQKLDMLLRPSGQVGAAQPPLSETACEAACTLAQYLYLVAGRTDALCDALADPQSMDLLAYVVGTPSLPASLREMICGVLNIVTQAAYQTLPSAPAATPPGSPVHAEGDAAAATAVTESMAAAAAVVAQQWLVRWTRHRTVRKALTALLPESIPHVSPIPASADGKIPLAAFSFHHLVALALLPAIAVAIPQLDARPDFRVGMRHPPRLMDAVCFTAFQPAYPSKATPKTAQRHDAISDPMLPQDNGLCLLFEACRAVGPARTQLATILREAIQRARTIDQRYALQTYAVFQGVLEWLLGLHILPTKQATMSSLMPSLPPPSAPPAPALATVEEWNLLGALVSGNDTVRWLLDERGGYRALLQLAPASMIYQHLPYLAFHASSEPLASPVGTSLAEFGFRGGVLEDGRPLKYAMVRAAQADGDAARYEALLSDVVALCYTEHNRLLLAQVDLIPFLVEQMTRYVWRHLAQLHTQLIGTLANHSLTVCGLKQMIAAMTPVHLRVASKEDATPAPTPTAERSRRISVTSITSANFNKKAPIKSTSWFPTLPAFDPSDKTHKGADEADQRWVSALHPLYPRLMNLLLTSFQINRASDANFLFDGKQSAIDLPPAMLPAWPPTGGYTVSFWFRMSQNSPPDDAMYLFSFLDAYGGSGLEMLVRGTKLRLIMTVDGEVTQVELPAPLTVKRNHWYYVAFVQQSCKMLWQTSSDASIFVNGKVRWQGKLEFLPTGDSAYFRFGARAWPEHQVTSEMWDRLSGVSRRTDENHHCFMGCMTNLRVDAAPLRLATLEQLYKAGRPLSPDAAEMLHHHHHAHPPVREDLGQLPDSGACLVFLHPANFRRGAHRVALNTRLPMLGGKTDAALIAPLRHVQIVVTTCPKDALYGLGGLGLLLPMVLHANLSLAQWDETTARLLLPEDLRPASSEGPDAATAAASAGASASTTALAAVTGMTPSSEGELNRLAMFMGIFVTLLDGDHDAVDQFFHHGQHITISWLLQHSNSRCLDMSVLDEVMSLVTAINHTLGASAARGRLLSLFKHLTLEPRVWAGASYEIQMEWFACLGQFLNKHLGQFHADFGMTYWCDVMHDWYWYTPSSHAAADVVNRLLKSDLRPMAFSRLHALRRAFWPILRQVFCWATDADLQRVWTHLWFTQDYQSSSEWARFFVLNAFPHEDDEAFLTGPALPIAQKLWETRGLAKCPTRMVDTPGGQVLMIKLQQEGHLLAGFFLCQVVEGLRDEEDPSAHELAYQALELWVQCDRAFAATWHAQLLLIHEGLTANVPAHPFNAIPLQQQHYLLKELHGRLAQLPKLDLLNSGVYIVVPLLSLARLNAMPFSTSTSTSALHPPMTHGEMLASPAVSTPDLHASSNGIGKADADAKVTTNGIHDANEAIRDDIVRLAVDLVATCLVRHLHAGKSVQADLFDMVAHIALHELAAEPTFSADADHHVDETDVPPPTRRENEDEDEEDAALRPPPTPKSPAPAERSDHGRASATPRLLLTNRVLQIVLTQLKIDLVDQFYSPTQSAHLTEFLTTVEHLLFHSRFILRKAARFIIKECEMQAAKDAHAAKAAATKSSTDRNPEATAASLRLLWEGDDAAVAASMVDDHKATRDFPSAAVDAPFQACPDAALALLGCVEVLLTQPQFADPGEVPQWWNELSRLRIRLVASSVHVSDETTLEAIEPYLLRACHSPWLPAESGLKRQLILGLHALYQRKKDARDPPVRDYRAYLQSILSTLEILVQGSTEPQWRLVEDALQATLVHDAPLRDLIDTPAWDQFVAAFCAGAFKQSTDRAVTTVLQWLSPAHSALSHRLGQRRAMLAQWTAARQAYQRAIAARRTEATLDESNYQANRAIEFEANQRQWRDKWASLMRDVTMPRGFWEPRRAVRAQPVAAAHDIPAIRLNGLDDAADHDDAALPLSSPPAVVPETIESMPQRTYWKLSTHENDRRMRNRLQPNFDFDDHADAARRRQLENDDVATEAPTVETSQAMQSRMKTLRSQARFSLETLNTADASARSQRDSPAPPKTAEFDETQWMSQLVDNNTRLIKASGQARMLPAMHEGSERAVGSYQVEIITLMAAVRGRLDLTHRHLVFVPDVGASVAKMTTAERQVLRSLMQDYGIESSHARDSRKWPLDSIQYVFLRRYKLRRSALELFFVDKANIFVNLLDDRQGTGTKNRMAFMSQLGAVRPLNLLRADVRAPSEILKTSGLTGRWQRHEISNFEYLMALNTISGRSFNDLTQYPVFPWILRDWTSPTLDLTNPHVFRDLSKPIGALDPERLKRLRERYHHFEDPNGEIPPFLYGSHYSTAGSTLYFLLRMEPFTSLHISLQGGKFDHADRQFRSLDATWRHVLRSQADFKELTPEFFYLPAFLENQNGFDLGTTQKGVRLGDVELPPWAENSDDFVRQHRLALESDYVSAHLHEWIDLIWGYKQRGPEAEAADNVFYYLTYEGMIDIDTIADPQQRSSMEDQINHFGQTPSQLLTKPHPPRLPRREFIHPTVISHADACHTYVVHLKDSAIKYVAVSKTQDVHRAQTQSFLASNIGNVLAALGTNEPCEKVVTIDDAQVIRCHAWFPAVNGLEMNFELDTGPVLQRQLPIPLGPSSFPLRPSLFTATPDGRYLFVAGTWDSTLEVLSVQSGLSLYRHVETRRGHASRTTAIALCSDSSCVLTGSADGNLIRWDLRSSVMAGHVRGRGAGKSGTGVSSGGGGGGGSAGTGGAPAGTGVGVGAAAGGVGDALSPGGTGTLSGPGGAPVVRHGTVFGPSHNGPVTCLAADARHHLAVSGSMDGTCLLVDLPTGLPLCAITPGRTCAAARDFVVRHVRITGEDGHVLIYSEWQPWLPAVPVDAQTAAAAASASVTTELSGVHESRTPALKTSSLPPAAAMTVDATPTSDTSHDPPAEVLSDAERDVSDHRLGHEVEAAAADAGPDKAEADITPAADDDDAHGDANNPTEAVVTFAGTVEADEQDGDTDKDKDTDKDQGEPRAATEVDAAHSDADDEKPALSPSKSRAKQGKASDTGASRSKGKGKDRVNHAKKGNAASKSAAELESKDAAADGAQAKIAADAHTVAERTAADAATQVRSEVRSEVAPTSGASASPATPVASASGPTWKSQLMLVNRQGGTLRWRRYTVCFRDLLLNRAGSHLIAADDACVVHVLDAWTLRILHRFPTQSPVNTLAFSGAEDVLFAGCEDGNMVMIHAKP